MYKKKKCLATKVALIPQVRRPNRPSGAARIRVAHVAHWHGQGERIRTARRVVQIRLAAI